MSQYYVGIKQVFAWAEEKDGKPGYAVVYRYGQPDAYRSWSPKDEFEKFYLPQGNDPSRVTQEMVDGFVADTTHPTTVGGKMTVLNVELKNGTVFAESSACVDPKNYDEKLGADICLQRVKDRVWHLLGFALQWARRGLSSIVLVAVLAAALPASAQSPGTVLVEQTVADGRGGTYTRIVERPAGYVPVNRPVPVYSAVQMHGAFAPAAPVTLYAPVPVYSAPPACVGGRCFR